MVIEKHIFTPAQLYKMLGTPNKAKCHYCGRARIFRLVSGLRLEITCPNPECKRYGFLYKTLSIGDKIKTDECERCKHKANDHLGNLCNECYSNRGFETTTFGDSEIKLCRRFKSRSRIVRSLRILEDGRIEVGLE